jgi:hypothetical protein
MPIVAVDGVALACPGVGAAIELAVAVFEGDVAPETGEGANSVVALCC